MIINWVAAKAQQFLPVQDTGLDEFNSSFDFALSPEIMNLLYAQNDDLDAGATTPRMGEVEQRREQLFTAGQQAEDVIAIAQLALDEHELALA